MFLHTRLGAEMHLAEDILVGIITIKIIFPNINNMCVEMKISEVDT